jgi:uncharacterized protein
VKSTRIELLEKFYRSFGEGNPEAAYACLHPDVIIDEAASLPYGGSFRGVEGIRTLLATIEPLLKENILRHELIDDGVRVAARMTFTFTSKKSGDLITMPVVEIYEFTDGLLSSIDIFYKDTKAMCDLVSAG